MFFSYQSAWSSPRQKLFLCKENIGKNITDIDPRGWKYRPSDNVCPARGDRVKCTVDSLLMEREYCWKLSPWMSGNWMFTLRHYQQSTATPPKIVKQSSTKKTIDCRGKINYGGTVSANPWANLMATPSNMPQTIFIRFHLKSEGHLPSDKLTVCYWKLP